MERETIKNLIKEKKEVTISLSNGRSYTGLFSSLNDIDYVTFEDIKGNMIFFKLSKIQDISLNNNLKPKPEVSATSGFFIDNKSKGRKQ